LIFNIETLLDWKSMESEERAALEILIENLEQANQTYDPPENPTEDPLNQCDTENDTAFGSGLGANTCHAVTQITLYVVSPDHHSELQTLTDM
jgi:hypothetical protein